jgi:chitinase
VPTAPVSVGFTTTDAPGANLASASADYDPVSGTLNFPAGVDTRTIGIAITGDQLVEGAEHFRVELQNASGAPIVDGIATLTILDDDVVSGARLSVGDVKVLETNNGTPNATMTVSLSAPSSGGVSVHYATLDGTARSSSDYSARSGTITFATGETAKPIPIPVNGDGAFEASETFTLKLTNAVGATIARAVGTVRIANDDPGPALAVSDASVVEGDSGSSFVGFSITLSTPAPQAVAVTYAVNHVTTNAGDIDLKSSTVSFPAGQLSATFQVKVFADTAPEPNETFSVTLSNPVNAALADPTGTGTVINDDPGSGRRVAIGDASLNEGNDGGRTLRFTVTCSTPSSTALKVSYATGGGSASAGGDYGAKSGTVTIRAGETSASVTIKIKGDAVPEPDETFRVTLSNPGSGATITRAIATGTIRTDD